MEIREPRAGLVSHLEFCFTAIICSYYNLMFVSFFLASRRLEAVRILQTVAASDTSKPAKIHFIFKSR